MISKLYQWQAEIQRHAGNTLDKERVMIYKASQNAKRSFLVCSDIVLTTYHEIMKSCPWPDAEQMANLKENFEDLDIAIENWISNSQDDACLLHKHTWYRVRGRIISHSIGAC
jgi:hypothetical protein